MAQVIVYSKPQCVQCKATTRALDKQGLAYKSIDVTESPDHFDYLKGLGVLQMPYVEVVDAEDSSSVKDSWTGFNPEKIKALSA